MTTIATLDPAALASGVRVAVDTAPEVVEQNGLRQVTAKVCPYGVIDTYNTSWTAGVFADSLREALGDERGAGASGGTIPVVFGHDERNVANVVGSVIGYRDDETGLHVTMQFANPDEVPSAKAVYSLIRDGHIRGYSFKYRDATLAPDPQHRGALQFTRARLVHVSPVVDPSIPGTATVGVRSETDPFEEDAMSQAMLEALGTLTDEVKALRSDMTTGAGTRTTATTDDPATPADLALSVATALAACTQAFSQRSADVPTELAGLVTAASIANEELLEALGVAEADVRAAQDTARADLADLAAAAEEGGTRAADYADPGYQPDKAKRYPLPDADHVRAAWSFINQEKNAAKYSAEDLAKVKDAIKAAAKTHGVDIAETRSAEDGDETTTPPEVADGLARLAKHGIR